MDNAQLDFTPFGSYCGWRGSEGFSKKRQQRAYRSAIRRAVTSPNAQSISQNGDVIPDVPPRTPVSLQCVIPSTASLKSPQIMLAPRKSASDWSFFEDVNDYIIEYRNRKLGEIPPPPKQVRPLILTVITNSKLTSESSDMPLNFLSLDTLVAISIRTS